MKQIILIPCWRRPEILGACLHHIEQAEGWRGNYYLFSIDRVSMKDFPGLGHDPEVVDLIAAWVDRTGVDGAMTIRPHRYNGNSFNLLEGYRDAVDAAEEQGAEIVTMIETDIFIGPDFFRWHSMAHRDFNPFFASACRNQNLKAELSTDPAHVYTHKSYQSLGVSWRAEVLRRHVLPHATEKYYRNMQYYTQRNFKIQPPAPWWEQDGLIYRILLNGDFAGLFPHVPRAYHAGFYGYNRRGKPLENSLSLEQRVQKILQMSEEEMNARAGQYKDITKCSLRGFPEVTRLLHHAP